MKEYRVHVGRPSWHQSRAGHRSASIYVVSTRERAEEYMANVKAHHPEEGFMFIEESDTKETQDLNKSLLSQMRQLGVKWKRGAAIPTYPHTMTDQQKADADKLYDSMSEGFRP